VFCGFPFFSFCKLDPLSLLPSLSPIAWQISSGSAIRPPPLLLSFRSCFREHSFVNTPVLFVGPEVLFSRKTPTTLSFRAPCSAFGANFVFPPQSFFETSLGTFPFSPLVFLFRPLSLSHVTLVPLCLLGPLFLSLWVLHSFFLDPPFFPFSFETEHPGKPLCPT